MKKLISSLYRKYFESGHRSGLFVGYHDLKLLIEYYRGMPRLIGHFSRKIIFLEKQVTKV